MKVIEVLGWLAMMPYVFGFRWALWGAALLRSRGNDRSGKGRRNG